MMLVLSLHTRAGQLQRMACVLLSMPLFIPLATRRLYFQAKVESLRIQSPFNLPPTWRSSTTLLGFTLESIIPFNTMSRSKILGKSSRTTFPKSLGTGGKKWLDHSLALLHTRHATHWLIAWLSLSVRRPLFDPFRCFAWIIRYHPWPQWWSCGHCHFLPLIRFISSISFLYKRYVFGWCLIEDQPNCSSWWLVFRFLAIMTHDNDFTFKTNL